MKLADDRWQRADQIFNQALDRPSAKRRAFLDEACGDDRELRALTDRLLAETEADDTLFSPGGGMAGPLVDELVDDIESRAGSSPGTEIGSYRIARELGRGGMAVVYLAERADGQFEQQVALKLIKLGTDTDEVIQRFDQERQILAMVRHPSIAQLLDGGVGPDGRPYFAMEYVDGQPIDQYCDAERLSIEERLRLFLRIARAVSYAHRNLVVHRDLKPSNILVSKDGHPKLLDFGIAKFLDPAAAPGRALETRTHARLMTPAFASPEQIRGAAVTTASDIYQLGLLLYLLLTGRWPYRFGSGDAADDVIRAICEEEPTRPSQVLTRGTSAVPDGEGPSESESISQARKTSARRLRHELSGDLDRIVLMAMRKEPERRYSSVAQLIDDLERYLSGRPVAAQTDTFFYRASKFVRRNAAASVVALVAVLLLASFGVLHTAQLTKERDRAQAAAARANQVADFLRGLFEVAAPTRSKGEQITARELLDKGARRIEEELAAQPDLQAGMMMVIGDVYRELAMFEEAEPLLEEAASLLAQTKGEDRLELANALHSLGHLTEDQGEVELAMAHYRQALEIRQSLIGPDHPDVAQTLDGIGRVFRSQGNFEQARQHHLKALALLEQALGPDHVDVGLVVKNLGIAERRDRKFDVARDHLKRAVSILRKHLGPDHPHLASAQIFLGDALRFTDDASSAREQYEMALPQMESAYGTDHPEVAVVLVKLGNLLNSSDPEKAIAFHERALAIRERAYGQAHPEVASSLNNLGLAYRRHDHEKAYQYFSRSAEVFASVYGRNHVEYAKPLKHIAGIQRYSGILEKSFETYRQVLEIRESTYGPDHSFLSEPLFELGRLNREMGEPEAAEPLLRRALMLAPDRAALAHSTLRTEIELGRCLTDLDRYDESEDLLRVIAADPSVEPVHQCRAMQALVELFERWGKPQQAKAQEALRLQSFTDDCWPHDRDT